MPNLSDATSLVDLFFRRVDESGQQPALHFKRDGAFQPLTWSEVAQEVRRYAVALGYFGLRPGDRVVQFSENRYEWIIADLAIMAARGIHVPLHAPLTGEQAAWQVRDSGAKIVLVSTQGQAEKLAASSQHLPVGLQYFSHDDFQLNIGSAEVRPLRDVAAQADQLNLHTDTRIEAAAIRDLTGDSLATILYTSGTTGEPKGVCLTHGNLVSNTLATLEMFAQHEDDMRLNFLPLSHIFARTCDLYTWIASGAQLALAESRETVIADCQAVRPTHISGVPYFYDKIFRGLSDAGVADQPGAVKELLGGRVRMCASGGAALPDHIFDFFQRQQTHICQGYGLSESSPVITVNPPGQARRSSAGRAIPGVEIRIADDGEILSRGPHIMRGYWNNEAATLEVLDDDGWLHTGDIGRLDDDGYLFITGRKKEIIVTALGKKVAPVLVESLLTEDPLIEQAVVIGDDRSYLTALLVPHAGNLQAEITRCGIAVASKEAALVNEEVLALYAACIAQRLRGLSQHEQVRKFTLVSRGFSIESGELTPKLSLRRKIIEKNFAAEIAAMYGAS